MLRGVLALLVGGLVAVGGIYAEEIKATFVKVDGKKLTVKVGDSEKTFTIDDKVMVKTKKDDVALTETFGRYKEGDKITLTVTDDKVTKAQGERKGGKDKKDSPKKDEPKKDAKPDEPKKDAPKPDAPKKEDK